MVDTLRHVLGGIVHLTPYENPLYFGLLAVFLVPIAFQMLRGKRILWYQTLITIVFLLISFGGPGLKPAFALVMYIVWQTVLASVYFKHRQKKNSNWGFYLAVVGAIAPLFLLKIIPFLWKMSLFSPVVAVHPGLQRIPSFIGFLGISYLTFKAVQVIMEMRDGLIKDFQLSHYLHFLLFFPTISSGPIDRYRRFEKDLVTPPSPEKYGELLDEGIKMIFKGFVYKFMFAYVLQNNLLPKVEAAALSDGGMSLGLLGTMYVYTLYLFFDFAGYSLFAVGTSYIMGYETPVNFNKPFISHNIKEFWNRWHMSLSFWFRDYVYMRLMFLLLKKKVFKSRIVASNVGYFALFILMGVWHGLTWYYLVYGLYHATLICLTDAWLRFKKKHKESLPSNRLTHWLAIFMTFQAVSFSLLIFSGFLDVLFKQ